MSEPAGKINLTELRKRAALSSSPAHVPVTRSEVLALLDAVEADLALDAAEAKGMGLDPAEHREAIARHDAALARFDHEPTP